MHKPTPTLSIICLIASKDFLIQLLSILPAKFRGALSSTTLNDMGDPFYALLAVVPVLILSGHTKLGKSAWYQRTLATQKIGLSLTVFTALASQVAKIMMSPLDTGIWVLITANLNFLCLILIMINWNRLYYNSSYDED